MNDSNAAEFGSRTRSVAGPGAASFGIFTGPVAKAEGPHRMGARWIGTDGWICVDRGGFETQPKSLMKEKMGPEEINLYRSNNHLGNFIDCVQSRRLTITPAEVAHRSASVGHLSVIAITLGRKIRWNPEKEEFVNDDSANGLLGKAKREPWQLG